MKIQWYPGHMTKARRAMEEDVRAVDLIIELVDARAPLSTRNPDIKILGGGKERIIIMNKADLADAAVSAAWERYFKNGGASCFQMDARNRGSLKRLSALIEEACKSRRERNLRRGILNRPVRAMVAGIPNVGKSTLINTIAGRGAARTGNRPGVTRGNQWIRLNRSVELLDTPGILWPKFEDPHVGEIIAFLGSVNELIAAPEELACALLRQLRRCGALEGAMRRFGISEELPEEEFLKLAALRRGCLLPGGLPDCEKVASVIMHEFRAGMFGRISLERPGERSGEEDEEALRGKAGAREGETESHARI